MSYSQRLGMLNVLLPLFFSLWENQVWGEFSQSWALQTWGKRMCWKSETILLTHFNTVALSFFFFFMLLQRCGNLTGFESHKYICVCIWLRIIVSFKWRGKGILNSFCSHPLILSLFFSLCIIFLSWFSLVIYHQCVF